jgi:hypothetical protein
MRLFLSFMIIMFVSNTSKAQQVCVNIFDSNSVNTFIKNSSVCEQISAALNFASNIGQEKGYGIKLLEALAKSTGKTFYIPIAMSYGILFTSSQRIEAIKEQLNELRGQKQCTMHEKN